MDDYMLSLAVVGIAALVMAWMPSFTKKTYISYSVLYLLLGIFIYAVVPGLPIPDPLHQQKGAIHLTELGVIISLMGTGLKIDRSFSFKKWKLPFRMVSWTMLLSIAAVTVAAWQLLHFDLPSALLLGAVLAPTDPVLASDVQVGPPEEKQRDDIRFTLTAEAGMNDGTAFPFTWLAVTVAIMMGTGETGLLEWVALDLIYRILIGVAIGYIFGKVLAHLLFETHPDGESSTSDGLVSLSATLAVYGITELAAGYGFIAVFVAAITIKNHEMTHEYHKVLHAFAEQSERILVAIILILFGGGLFNGMLDALNWPMAIFGIAFLFLIRPVASMIGLIGSDLHLKEKSIISFYGIRGIGSFFYLAFGLDQTEFFYGKELWATVAFIVTASIVVHGLSATYVMETIGKRFRGDEEVN